MWSSLVADGQAATGRGGKAAWPAWPFSTGFLAIHLPFSLSASRSISHSAIPMGASAMTTWPRICEASSCFPATA
eukprot:10733632-Alexandrium_andersonii.AAC.1